MSVRDVNVIDCSIEDFAQLIIDKTSTFTSLKNDIYTSGLTGKEMDCLMNRLA